MSEKIIFSGYFDKSPVKGEARSVMVEPFIYEGGNSDSIVNEYIRQGLAKRDQRMSTDRRDTHVQTYQDLYYGRTWDIKPSIEYWKITAYKNEDGTYRLVR